MKFNRPIHLHGTVDEGIVLGVYNSDIFNIKIDIKEHIPVRFPDEAEMLAKTQEALGKALRINNI